MTNRLLSTTMALATSACLAACVNDESPSVSETGAGDSWDEFRAHPPITWDEFKASVHRESFEPYPYIVDGDIPLYGEDELRQFYDAWLADAYASQHGSGSALTVRRVSGADKIWPVSTRNALTYCISDTFGTRKSTLVTAMGRATRSWSARVAVKFIYRPDQDATCNNANNNVLFNVSPAVMTANASAFFPDFSRSQRQLLLADSAFTTTAGGRDLQGILRHETGHILGFLHEHLHINCGETDPNNRQVTSYDVNSVMHYPQCRPSGTGGYRQTVLDFAGATSLYGNAPRFSDILFQHANNGLVAEWLILDGGFVDPIDLVGPGAQAVGSGDFNGDGTSDILFQHANQGLVATWLISNGQIAEAIDFVGPGAKVVGTGDFNGDGTTDILFQHTDTLLVAVWLMQNGHISEARDIRVGPAKVVATGDFNNDGITDVLFQHDNAGQVKMWTMANVRNPTQIDLLTPGAFVVGTGDFNGDGTSDILFQHANQGLVAFWLISNGQIVGAQDLFSPGAAVVGTGDFNSDGTSDILFQHANDGLVAWWLISNGQFAGVRELFSPGAKVVGTGNFDGR